MYSALYYPFTGPEQQSFLKTALFLWDSVDFIVPYRQFHRYGHDTDVSEALEVIGREYIPTKKDQRDVHDELQKICNGEIGSRFHFELQSPGRVYDFYPQKLMHETWEMLEQSKLARVVAEGSHVSRASTGPLFGYYMMTILAVCCARNRKRLVTDLSDPYRALANLLGDDLPPDRSPDDWHGRLISLSLSGPDFGNISLPRLVELRRREDKLLAELRRNFLSAVDEAATDISANADNPNVIRDRIESYTDSMEKDLKELKRSLNRSAASLILSKEFGISVLAVAATATVNPASGLFAVGGLSKGLIDYQDRRRKLLKDHPSSWLLSATGPRVPFT